mgnify:CR=1 FL=1
MTGYVFVDNFSVEEIEEENFIARKEVYKEAEDGKYFMQDDKYIEITRILIFTYRTGLSCSYC